MFRFCCPHRRTVWNIDPSKEYYYTLCTLSQGLNCLRLKLLVVHFLLCRTFVVVVVLRNDNQIRLTVGLCIRWQAINNRRGEGGAQLRKEKWSSCSGKRHGMAFPVKPVSGLKGKGGSGQRIGGNVWCFWQICHCECKCQVRMCIRRLLVTQNALLLIFPFVSGWKKRHVLSQMFHWRAHHRQKWSGWVESSIKLNRPQILHCLSAWEQRHS